MHMCVCVHVEARRQYQLTYSTTSILVLRIESLNLDLPYSTRLAGQQVPGILTHPISASLVQLLQACPAGPSLFM